MKVCTAIQGYRWTQGHFVLGHERPNRSVRTYCYGIACRKRLVQIFISALLTLHLSSSVHTHPSLFCFFNVVLLHRFRGQPAANVR